jgi:hypothetical protein
VTPHHGGSQGLNFNIRILLNTKLKTLISLGRTQKNVDVLLIEFFARVFFFFENLMCFDALVRGFFEIEKSCYAPCVKSKSENVQPGLISLIQLNQVLVFVLSSFYRRCFFPYNTSAEA